MREVEILAIAAIFTACHSTAPWLFRLSEHVRRGVASLSGGLAAAYVCLHLLPEIDEGGRLLGPRVYLVVLLGLAVAYGMEIVIHRHRARHGSHPMHMAAHVAVAAVYNFLLMLTLGEQLPSSAALSVVFAVTMGMHLISTDFGLQEAYPIEFTRRGRCVLIGAILSGYIVSHMHDPHAEVVDVLTAVLAGFMLLTIFRKELPEFHETHYRAFLVGIGLFFVAHIVLSGAV